MTRTAADLQRAAAAADTTETAGMTGTGGVGMTATENGAATG